MKARVQSQYLALELLAVAESGRNLTQNVLLNHLQLLRGRPSSQWWWNILGATLLVSLMDVLVSSTGQFDLILLKCSHLFVESGKYNLSLTCDFVQSCLWYKVTRSISLNSYQVTQCE